MSFVTLDPRLRGDDGFKFELKAFGGKRREAILPGAGYEDREGETR